eukprot:SAG25_NODE_962_length_4542_cov_45.139545_3_plen_123_part_00
MKRSRGLSRPFPSWNRSILTEIYICHACSYHEINDGNGRAGAKDPGGPNCHEFPAMIAQLLLKLGVNGHVESVVSTSSSATGDTMLAVSASVEDVRTQLAQRDAEIARLMERLATFEGVPDV